MNGESQGKLKEKKAADVYGKKYSKGTHFLLHAYGKFGILRAIGKHCGQRIPVMKL